jgi:hypothetical protein
MIAARIGMVGAVGRGWIGAAAAGYAGRGVARIAQIEANAANRVGMHYCGLGPVPCRVRAERMMQSSDIDEGRQISV